MPRSIWDLERNDVDGAVWCYEHLPLTSAHLATLVLLQDDPADLFRRLKEATRASVPPNASPLS
jgi:hypothetical protein